MFYFVAWSAPKCARKEIYDAHGFSGYSSAFEVAPLLRDHVENYIDAFEVF